MEHQSGDRNRAGGQRKHTHFHVGQREQKRMQAPMGDRIVQLFESGNSIQASIRLRGFDEKFYSQFRLGRSVLAGFLFGLGRVGRTRLARRRMLTIFAYSLVHLIFEFASRGRLSSHRRLVHRLHRVRGALPVATFTGDQESVETKLGRRRRNDRLGPIRRRTAASTEIRSVADSIGQRKRTGPAYVGGQTSTQVHSVAVERSESEQGRFRHWANDGADVPIFRRTGPGPEKNGNGEQFPTNVGTREGRRRRSHFVSLRFRAFQFGLLGLLLESETHFF